MERKGIDIREGSAQQCVRTAAMDGAAFQDNEVRVSSNWQTASFMSKDPERYSGSPDM